jgi:eukaryotic-like serine/threonine-protein kinase
MVLLAQRYEMRRQIGAGGMGTVWEAWDVRLHRAVAVKLPTRALSAEPAFVARFEREARHAAHLNHPNIVTIFDLGTDGDVSYLVMELVIGESVAELLRRKGQLDEARTIDICRSVLSGLAEAHAHHIIHRDIKPSNTLMSRTGLIKIADFGIARSLGESTVWSDTGAVGTVGYLSPEQCAGGAATERSDIYAVGCLAYQCLSGRPPFTGETPVSIMQQHQHAEPPPVGGQRSDLSSGLVGAINIALQKCPDHRFATAHDMNAAIGSSPISGRSWVPPGTHGATGVVERTSVLPRTPSSTGKRKRRPFLLGAVAVILMAVSVLLVAVAAAGTVVATHHHGPERPTVGLLAARHDPLVRRERGRPVVGQKARDVVPDELLRLIRVVRPGEGILDRAVVDLPETVPVR